jgi:signal transduction histidine kinase
LEWLADQVREETGLSTTVECGARDLPLDDVTRTLLFSAVRELLVNVVKHARARSAQVSVSRDDEHVRISVADDGVGCETEATSSTLNGSGFGLFNIRERLGHLGGRLEVASDPGAGYRATLVAPIRPAAGPSPAVGPARPEEHALR